MFHKTKQLSNYFESCITGTYLRVLFLAKSNFFADTAKVGRCNLQIGGKFFERNILQYIRTASYQLPIPFFGRLPIKIEVSVMSLPK